MLIFDQGDGVYKLIFVDDEDIIREGITSRIRWEENGFELTGVFDNGSTALEFIRENDVDVVLSDISMPKMDGLTLSKKLAETHPRIQILLLTGFDEFEYAQEAVRNRVKEFLLKPITAEELSEVLERTKVELDRIAKAEREQEHLKELLDQSLPLLKERFFYRLVSGKIGPEDFRRRLSFFGWKDECGFCKTIIVSYPDEWDELTRLALAENARKSIEEYDAVFSNRNEDLVILFRGPETTSLETRVSSIAEGLFTTALSLGETPVIIGIGETTDHLEDVNRSYLGAGSAVDHARILGLSRIQSVDDIRRKSRVSQEALISRIRRLMTALREGVGRSSVEALENIFSLFEESYLTFSDVVDYLARLQYHLSDFIDEMNLDGEGIFEDLSLSAETRHFARLSDAEIFYKEKIRSIEEHIRRRRNDAVHSRVDKARNIISRRFVEKDFSLRDICAELYLSTSQFSTLFKEGTGRTFVEYLTETRVNEAKRLLKTTDMKSYEVADAVGYQDPRYFSSIFKKVTGFTTTEYRREMED